MCRFFYWVAASEKVHDSNTTHTSKDAAIDGNDDKVAGLESRGISMKTDVVITTVSGNPPPFKSSGEDVCPEANVSASQTINSPSEVQQATTAASLAGNQVFEAVVDVDESVAGGSRMRRASNNRFFSDEELGRAVTMMDEVEETPAGTKESETTVPISYKMVVPSPEPASPDDDESSSNEVDDIADVVEDPPTKSSPRPAKLPKKKSKVKTITAMTASAGLVARRKSVEISRAEAAKITRNKVTSSKDTGDVVGGRSVLESLPQAPDAKKARMILLLLFSNILNSLIRWIHHATVVLMDSRGLCGAAESRSSPIETESARNASTITKDVVSRP